MTPRRPRPHQHQPAARRRGHAGRARRRPGHRLRGARPRRRPTPVRRRFRLHRRRPRPDHPLGRRGRRPLGDRRRAARRVRDGEVRAQHLAGRARPDPARRRDERRRPPPPRPRAPARRRRQQRHRPRRPARRAARPARALPRRPGDAAAVGRLDRRAARRRTRAHRRAHSTTPGRSRSSSASWPAPSTASDRRARSPLRLRRRPRDARSPGSAGRPTRANFRTGTLTVCTMVPMRSVPHRVVCLVGLDDGVFPRAGVGRRRRRARPGGRSPASATPAARTASSCSTRCSPPARHLVITYTGANEHSGARRPPAVPLGEILDAARPHHRRAGARRGCWSATRSSPYDARNFEPRPARREPGRSASTGAALAGAQAGGRPAQPAPARSCAGPLPARDRSRTSRWPTSRRSSPIPVRAFLRSRLDVSTPFEADELRRRDPGRPRRARAVGGRRPAAARGAGRPGPGRRDDRRAAARHAAARRPRRAARCASVTEECQKLLARTAELRDGERRARRRRRRPRRRPPADRHRLRRLRQPHRVRSATPGSRPGSGSAPGSTCSRSAPHPDENWTAHAVGRERAGPSGRSPVRSTTARRLAARAGRAARPRAARAAAAADADRRARGPRRTPAS